jgi:hypothetical protein
MRTGENRSRRKNEFEYRKTPNYFAEREYLRAEPFPPLALGLLS